MKTFSVLSLAIALTAGCAQNLETDTGTPAEIYVEQDNSEVEELKS